MLHSGLGDSRRMDNWALVREEHQDLKLVTLKSGRLKSGTNYKCGEHVIAMVNRNYY